MMSVGPSPSWLHINGSCLWFVIVGNFMCCLMKVTDFTFVVQKDNHVVRFVWFFKSWYRLIQNDAFQGRLLQCSKLEPWGIVPTCGDHENSCFQLFSGPKLRISMPKLGIPVFKKYDHTPVPFSLKNNFSSLSTLINRWNSNVNDIYLLLLLRNRSIL